jgi:hypothetical protein
MKTLVSWRAAGQSSPPSGDRAEVVGRVAGRGDAGVGDYYGDVRIGVALLWLDVLVGWGGVWCLWPGVGGGLEDVVAVGLCGLVVGVGLVDVGAGEVVAAAVLGWGEGGDAVVVHACGEALEGGGRGDGDRLVWGAGGGRGEVERFGCSA